MLDLIVDLLKVHLTDKDQKETSDVSLHIYKDGHLHSHLIISVKEGEKPVIFINGQEISELRK